MQDRLLIKTVLSFQFPITRNAILGIKHQCPLVHRYLSDNSKSSMVRIQCGMTVGRTAPRSVYHAAGKEQKNKQTAVKLIYKTY